MLGLLWRSGTVELEMGVVRCIVHICKTFNDILKDNVKLA